MLRPYIQYRIAPTEFKQISSVHQDGFDVLYECLSVIKDSFPIHKEPSNVHKDSFDVLYECLDVIKDSFPIHKEPSNVHKDSFDVLYECLDVIKDGFDILYDRFDAGNNSICNDRRGFQLLEQRLEQRDFVSVCKS